MRIIKDKHNRSVVIDSTNKNAILLKKYPSLTVNELRICSYLLLNISSKEIAELTKRSIRSIESTRLNIRKKMKLSHNENLVKCLMVAVEE